MNVTSHLLPSVARLLLLELLKLLLMELLKFPLLQDLQHICQYPAMEQYRLNTSIRQNAERSPRQRCPGGGTGDQTNRMMKKKKKMMMKKKMKKKKPVEASWWRLRVLLEEIFGAGKSGLDLDSHRMMAFFWSPAGGDRASDTQTTTPRIPPCVEQFLPLQGGAWQARLVIG